MTFPGPIFWLFQLLWPGLFMPSLIKQGFKFFILSYSAVFDSSDPVLLCPIP
jgi:hypothetical protein